MSSTTERSLLQPGSLGVDLSLLFMPLSVLLKRLLYRVLGVATLHRAARTRELLPLDDPELLTVVKPDK